MILATCSPSDEIPPEWWPVAFWAFVVGSVFAGITSLYACFARNRAAWFRPVVLMTLLPGGLVLGFAAYVYYIDYVPVDGDGTKASPPFWEALAIPALPVFAALAALTIYSRRTGRAAAEKHTPGAAS